MESRTITRSAFVLCISLVMPLWPSCAGVLPALKSDEYLVASGSQVHLEGDSSIGYAGSGACQSGDGGVSADTVCFVFCFDDAPVNVAGNTCVEMVTGQTVVTPRVELTLLGVYSEGVHIRVVVKQ